MLVTSGIQWGDDSNSWERDHGVLNQGIAPGVEREYS